MNIIFWLLVTGLVLVAVLIVAVPLWRKSAKTTGDVEEHNIEIARQRLADLKRQLRDGILPQQEYDAQRRELELALNDDLDSREANRQEPIAHQGRWAIALIAWFIPMVSVFGYWLLGEPHALDKMRRLELAQQQQEVDQETVNRMVERLAERLKDQPEDAEGWLMLARSYKYLERYPESVSAFAEAYRLLGDRPDVMLQYADVLAQVDRSFKGRPAELVFKALTLEPSNQTGLWLAGMAKVESGELPQALIYWRKLETLLPENSAEQADLRRLIASVTSQPQESPAASASPASIKVNVNLAEALQTQANATDIVFIYAQALSGPKMPLAIMRKTVEELPFSVVLDDSSAMMPGMNLSSAEQIKVIARITQDGRALPQSGDLIGITELRQIEDDQVVTVTIDQRIQ